MKQKRFSLIYKLLVSCSESGTEWAASYLIVKTQLIFSCINILQHRLEKQLVNSVRYITGADIYPGLWRMNTIILILNIANSTKTYGIKLLFQQGHFFPAVGSTFSVILKKLLKWKSFIYVWCDSWTCCHGSEVAHGPSWKKWKAWEVIRELQWLLLDPLGMALHCQGRL